ncbi:MAG: hypothetical protein C0393_04205 [Anaerolinea sp.]|nr:hypothetical protein [Anaerolinea sp.]
MPRGEFDNLPGKGEPLKRIIFDKIPFSCYTNAR